MNIDAFESFFYEEIKKEYPQLNPSNVRFTYDVQRNKIATLKTKNIPDSLKGDILMFAEALFEKFKNQ